MKKLFIVFLLIALVGCSQSAVQTKANLAAINLDKLPYQSGDLPSQYPAGQIAYKWAKDLPEPIAPDNSISQNIGKDVSSDLTNNYTMIALYFSIDDLNKEFEAIVATYPTKATQTTVGEKSSFAMINNSTGEGFLVFARCHAVVAIHLTGPDMSEALLTSYAQKIDTRIKPIICD